MPFISAAPSLLLTWFRVLDLWLSFWGFEFQLERELARLEGELEDLDALVYPPPPRTLQ